MSLVFLPSHNKRMSSSFLLVSVAAEGNFDSRSLGLRAQKKLAGKLASKKIAKQFIDDTSGRLLDNIYKAAKEYFDKKTAEKAIKHLIKTVIKIGILYRNDQFNAEEKQLAEDFKKKFRTVAMTLISFYEVDFTFDKNYLVKNLLECLLMCRRRKIEGSSGRAVLGGRIVHFRQQ